MIFNIFVIFAKAMFKRIVSIACVVIGIKFIIVIFYLDY